MSALLLWPPIIVAYAAHVLGPLLQKARQAGSVGQPCFEPLVLEIWICFGFRASDFEDARILHPKTLVSTAPRQQEEIR